jgi:uncharacterized membrane protein (UPF0127 family)
LTRRALIAFVLIFLVLIPWGTVGWADGALPVEAVAIETDHGRTVIEAEIAATPEARATGLMFRATMAQDHGMLFDFGKPRAIAMWMKNTRISLDMIFADTAGRVIGIAENTVPMSTTTIAVDKPVMAVLEVNAGTARRLGLKPGDRLVHRLFNGGG